MANSIDGRLVSATTRKPLPDLTVVASSTDQRPGAGPLGSAVSNAEGAFSIPLDPRLFKTLVDSAVDVGFQVLGSNREPLTIGGRVLWNGRRADQPVVIVVRDVAPPVPDPTDLYSVQGVLTNETGVASTGLRVEVWDHNVDGQTLIGTSVTGSDGHYSVTYDPAALGGKAAGDVEIRVVDPRRDGGEIARSGITFQAPRHTTIDLGVAGDKVVRTSEYDRLVGAIQPLLGDRSLGDVDADGVTFLAGRSGWDARSIAMAARSAKLSADTLIPADHYYALLRSGLPGEATTIHRLDDKQVVGSIERAMKDGIIPSSDSIDETIRLHQAAAAKVLTTFTPATALSSLGEMMSLRLNVDQQATFLDVYRANSDDPAAMWTALGQRGFEQATIDSLQTDAALGQLTLQNAKLIGRLTSDAGVTKVADLVDRGFYKPDAWANVVGNDVPAGVSTQEYAAGLAAQVSATYPTLVTADLVRSNAISVQTDGAAAEVATFLSNHGSFEIGKQPVATWGDFEHLSGPARDGVQLVERLFQISPSNESMIALSKLGINSAMQVMKYSPDTFVSKFGGEFPSKTEALMVHKKAQEVHTTALNVATMYLSYRAAPNLFAITGLLDRPTVVVPKPEIVASATLEELFGNMDYCACEQCRSVQSPAAYLVELLEFIDLSDVPHTLQNPLDVLLGRRPDLQHIQLSCENTNIALPYIDLVNEVLEYYIVHGNLTAFTGHDTPLDAKTADLLADPEFVIDAAYDQTKANVYPSSLPFDMPLVHLRLLFEVWDTSLANALDAFGDAASSRRERLRLNAPEYRILTDIEFRKLPEYFGEPAVATIDALNAVVGNAKTFCRRVGIRYTELADVLTTEFVNPGVTVVPLLEQLGVDLGQIQSRFDGTLSDPDFTALLPAGLDAVPYGGDVLQWLDDNRALIMGLVTLTDLTDDPGECDFGKVELRFSLPDMSANRITEIAYHRLHRFIRLWRKLGWSMALTDRAITAFLGVPSSTLTTANIDGEFASMLARLANFAALIDRLSVSTKKLPDWLALWDIKIDPAARQVQLARMLKIGTTDLAHLIDITGLDPFAADMETDAPSMLRFIDLWTTLKTSPLKVVDLDYLLRHDDLNGKLTPTTGSIRRDLKSLRDSLTAVDADLNVAPATADLAAARTKMALVYDAAVVDEFFGLVARSITYSAPLGTDEEVLPSSLTTIAPTLALDPFQKTLTYGGTLSAATQTALANAADALTLGDVEIIQNLPDLATFVADVKTALQVLRDAGDADLATLGNDYPELKALYDSLAVISEPAAQAAAILSAILPELRASLKAAAARNGLVAGTKADPLVIDAITSVPTVVHAAGDATKGVLADFLGLEQPVPMDANQTYSLFLDPPATDSYILYVSAPQNTQVTLMVDGVAAIPPTVVGANSQVHSAVPLGLTAGSLVAVELTLSALPVGEHAELRWRTKGSAQAAIPPSRQYDSAALGRASTSLIRVQKTVLLQRALGLTAAEVAHLGAQSADTMGIWNALDTDGTITAGDLHTEWQRVAWLIWFTQLKRDHESDPDSLLSVLRQPDLVNAQGRLVVAGVMEWSEVDLSTVLGHFGLVVGDLAELHNFRRVAQTLDLVATTLQPAADLITWSVANPDGPLVTTIQATLRARMDDASWLETMQSVSDQLRNARRDALVATILFHNPPEPEIETADHLYEYFLIDVQMDACMQTSRIRQALSTVQLFINRCLMNLETEVSPDSVREDQWQWMKRYRVWEANRKVFLYPENWLEPELRDNKSPFFSDLESELLKADITTDAAEVAYLSYLKKLDDVARLNIVGAYLEQHQAGNPDDDVLHVFGRTMGTTREHWYRRYEYGYWTPWEKVSLNIEGDLVVPVVWKSQLFVFWVSAVVKAEGNNTDSPQAIADEPWGGNARVSADLTLHWGEYYRGKWTSPKSTEASTPIRLTNLAQYEANKLVIATRTFTPNANVSERLVLTLLNMNGGGIYTVTFTSKHCAPLVAAKVDNDLFENVDVFNYRLLWSGRPSAVLDANSLLVPSNVMDVHIEQPDGSSVETLTEVVLTKTSNLVEGFRVRPVMHPAENQWELPFFYTDERSVFFVAGDESVHVINDRYYVDDFVPQFGGVIKDIPQLYEEPVITVKPRPGDPVTDPFIDLVNPNYKVLITDNSVFDFGGTPFNATGAVNATAFH